MADVAANSLDDRCQQMLAKASAAYDRGDFDYVAGVAAGILEIEPGCLPVRRLQRAAQLRRRRAVGARIGATLRSAMRIAAFRLGGASCGPEQMLATAERALAANPANVAALKLLAEAAERLGWPETAAFALEAICEIEPHRRANQLALGEAWLAAGKPSAALALAGKLVAAKPHCAAAQSLVRAASVAQTIASHGWDLRTGFRDKLRHGTRVPQDSAAGARPRTSLPSGRCGGPEPTAPRLQFGGPLRGATAGGPLS